MNRMVIFAPIALALSLGTASAQSQQPYAGLQTRPIKAISEQQIADLKAGRGMSLALAAELNGYPGPKHVLEHMAEAHTKCFESNREQNHNEEIRSSSFAVAFLGDL